MIKIIKIFGRIETFTILQFLINQILKIKIKWEIRALEGEYRDFLFNRFEPVLNPKICIVVDKDCNYKIFNKVLGKEKIGFFKSSSNKKMAMDRHLTEMYIKGQDLPESHTYALLSPFISSKPFLKTKYFYTTYTHLNKVDDQTKTIFYNIVDYLVNSGLESYNDDVITFKKESTDKYDLIIAKLKGCGSFVQTYYHKKNRIMNQLSTLKLEDAKYSNILDKITTEMIKILSSAGIFEKNFSIEEFPDVIPLIFPLKMFDQFNLKGPVTQLITVGFDLRNCLKSDLSYLFNRKNTEKLIKEGGVWYFTKVWGHLC